MTATAAAWTGHAVRKPAGAFAGEVPRERTGARAVFGVPDIQAPTRIHTQSTNDVYPTAVKPAIEAARRSAPRSVTRPPAPAL
ncbi:hypothetical protein [Streptomyces sp. NPDC004629]|uniref:hypothetical protein n=1 Tax=Streptomyces sp. NPDC004629 TaxID=3364705 RepID=UPI0036860E9D